MIRFKSTLPFRSPLFALAMLLILSTLSLIAASTARSAQPAGQPKQISTAGDHGRVIRLAPEDLGSPVSAQKHDTVTYSLRKGDTEFVISLPKMATVDKLTFLNENAAAAGELVISVSNDRLPVDSPKWTRVEGAISFEHKRTFDLSLIGIEAKFVKLSFRVTKMERLAGVDFSARRGLF